MKGHGNTTAFIGAAVGVVAVAVVAGLLVLPSPRQERARHLDERRVEDLRGIARAVDLYWTRHDRLPRSLEDISSEAGLSISSRDPDTAQEYEFRALEGATYELCASFAATSAPTHEPGTPARNASDDFWSHGAGRRCFRLEAQEVPSREGPGDSGHPLN